MGRMAQQNLVVALRAFADRAAALMIAATAEIVSAIFAAMAADDDHTLLAIAKVIAERSPVPDDPLAIEIEAVRAAYHAATLPPVEVAGHSHHGRPSVAFRALCEDLLEFARVIDRDGTDEIAHGYAEQIRHRCAMAADGEGTLRAVAPVLQVAYETRELTDETGLYHSAEEVRAAGAVLSSLDVFYAALADAPPCAGCTPWYAPKRIESTIADGTAMRDGMLRMLREIADPAFFEDVRDHLFALAPACADLAIRFRRHAARQACEDAAAARAEAALDAGYVTAVTGAPVDAETALLLLDRHSVKDDTIDYMALGQQAVAAYMNAARGAPEKIAVPEYVARVGARGVAPLSEEDVAQIGDLLSKVVLYNGVGRTPEELTVRREALLGAARAMDYDLVARLGAWIDALQRPRHAAGGGFGPGARGQADGEERLGRDRDPQPRAS